MNKNEKPDFNARMEREMKTLQQNIQATEKAYGENLFDLTVARSYIKKLLGNAKVTAHLKANHPGIFSDFKTILKVDTLALH